MTVSLKLWHWPTLILQKSKRAFHFSFQGLKIAESDNCLSWLVNWLKMRMVFLELNKLFFKIDLALINLKRNSRLFIFGWVGSRLGYSFPYLEYFFVIPRPHCLEICQIEYNKKSKLLLQNIIKSVVFTFNHTESKTT